ncbi:MAG: DUF2851 family protein [Sphingobacteriales bacterium]|nr:DUF2851 family protein [Sphingobacteriales bacterium]
MQERLLHFIWQNKLFNTKELKTVKGNEVQILDFGKYNKDGGPDFWNAKVKIDRGYFSWKYRTTYLCFRLETA